METIHAGHYLIGLILQKYEEELGSIFKAKRGLDLILHSKNDSQEPSSYLDVAFCGITDFMGEPVDEKEYELKLEIDGKVCSLSGFSVSPKKITVPDLSFSFKSENGEYIELSAKETKELIDKIMIVGWY